ncbi:putative O-linked N-acetylglucosamine transferase, SPINDLY family [Bacteroidales bacterium Barb6]|nr:putative O-linked N-acetylglucosamine transferase, SPINDLY family [Bacteroidales bacterium Barb6]
MKYIEKLILCLITFIFCAEAVSAQKAERENVRDGNKLFKEEKFTESEIAYRKGIDVNPRSVEGMYNLGNALYKQNKLPEAAEQYQLIAGQGDKLAQTPEGRLRLSEVYHNTGNISMQNKDYAKSIEAYKQALRMNPGDHETRYNLALAQKLLQDQQQQNEDQNQEQQKEEQKDENKEQQDQQQQQNDQKQDKTQEKAQPNEQMSQDNAKQILDAFLQDEKDTQEKVKQMQMQQQQKRRSEKEW